MEDKTKRRKMMSRLAKHVRAMLKSGASGQDQLAQRGMSQLVTLASWSLDTRVKRFSESMTVMLLCWFKFVFCLAVIKEFMSFIGCAKSKPMVHYNFWYNCARLWDFWVVLSESWHNWKNHDIIERRRYTISNTFYLSLWTKVLSQDWEGPSDIPDLRFQLVRLTLSQASFRSKSQSHLAQLTVSPGTIEQIYLSPDNGLTGLTEIGCHLYWILWYYFCDIRGCAWGLLDVIILVQLLKDSLCAGLFIGMFGAHGPEVIQVQRVIGPV